MESQCIQPEPIAGSSQPVLLQAGQEASRHTVHAAPFLARIHGHPFVSNATSFDNLLKEGERLQRHGAGNMGCLAGIVSDQTDRVRQGSVLAFGSLIKDRKAVRRVEE